MRAGIQSKLNALGNEGCYLISLLCAAGYEGDIVRAYDECLDEGLIEADCYVNDPVALLNKYGANVGKVVKTANVVDRPAVTIAQYENGRLRHFVLCDSIFNEIDEDEWTTAGDGRRVFDPLGDSNCVRYGRCISYRLFY